jgi:hypothetical protein
VALTRDDEGGHFAAYIVRACNAHEELVRALEHCSVQLTRLDPLANHHDAALIDNTLALARGKEQS